LPEKRSARCVGLVHGYNPKLKRRLFDVLKSQRLQANQDVTFLTDGGEEVRALTELVTPASEHVLDWFHITMRLTVLAQYARGVAHHDDAEAFQDVMLNNIPWRRFGTPRMVRQPAPFLASPAGDYLTGEVLAVNGGAFAERAYLPLNTPKVRGSTAAR
jgi:hypothetical protein